MITKGEGIILRCVNYSNTSQITTLYTPTNGKTAVIAKGVRKGKPSRQFPGPMELSTHIDFVVYQRNSSSLAILQEYQLKNSFHAIRRDLRRIFTTLYLIEFVRETTIEADPCPELFSLLVNSLQLICEGKPLEHIRFFFQINALALVGLVFETNFCCGCGGKFNSHFVTFSMKKCAFFCVACRRLVEGGVQLRRETIVYLQSSANLAYNQLRTIQLPIATVRELDTFFRLYLRNSFNKDFKTARYLK